MLTPSKFTPFDETVIFRMLSILNTSKESESLLSTFYRTKENFADSSEFLYAIDILFIVDKIEIDLEKGVIHYVKSNTF